NADRLWHDERMLQWARALVGIVSDLLRLGVLFLRSSNAIRAENLVLRRQLARYIERGIKSRRVDQVTRVSLALFTRLFDWRDSVAWTEKGTGYGSRYCLLFHWSKQTGVSTGTSEERIHPPRLQGLRKSNLNDISLLRPGTLRVRASDSRIVRRQR